VLLREGRTQQIRKMFQAVGHPVSKLRRVAIGPISDPKLTPGDWRELTPREVKMLATMQEPAKPKARRAPAARAASPKKTAVNVSAAKKRGAAPARKTATSRKAAAPRTSSTRQKSGPRAATPRTASARPAPRKATPRNAAGATRRGRG
jgi:hypothetical protein